MKYERYVGQMPTCSVPRIFRLTTVSFTPVEWLQGGVDAAVEMVFMLHRSFSFSFNRSLPLYVSTVLVMYCNDNT